MLWNLEDLIQSSRETTVEIKGRWLPARPLSGPIVWRFKAAWMVLVGKADAFVWPGGQ